MVYIVITCLLEFAEIDIIVFWKLSEIALIGILEIVCMFSTCILVSIGIVVLVGWP